MGGEHLYEPVSQHSKGFPEVPPEPHLDLNPRRSAKSRLLQAAIIVASVAFLASPYYWSIYNKQKNPPSDDPELSGFCPTTRALPTKAPKPNVWKNLDVSEAASVRKWLMAPEQGLNLTSTRKATALEDTIFLVEAHRPPKAAVLDFLDGTGPKPAKYAHAIVHHATHSPPSIVDYLVGPLPISPKTTFRPLKENYAIDPIPLAARAFAISDFQAFGSFMHRTFEPLTELTMDLFGAKASGLANDTLIGAASSPVSFDGSWRKMWMPIKLNVPGSYLHSLDLYLYVDMTSLDHAEWEVIRVVYNHQVFDTLDAFADAWRKKTLKRSPKPVLNDTDWATRAWRGKKRDLDHLTGPRSVQFDGPRFRADVAESYVTWMGWSMYFGFERDMGLGLWSVGFRGERIIYELTPQEALAQYSGNDPGQSSTVWLDRAFGMGAMVKELMVGYDCPTDSLYLPVTVHTSMGSVSRNRAVCVFERESGRPLSRHFGEAKDEMGATKGFEFVVRSISTVGNYDYLFDYTFQLDGTLEVRFSASGYLQGNYWDPLRDSFGTRIRETTQGALHDHVINYKVDFDILGTKNSISTISLEVQEIEQPWFDDDWGTTNVQQAIVKRTHLNESTTKFEHPKNGEGILLITNEDEKNAWGVPRGYAVHPGASNIHLTNLDNKRTLRNVQWAKKHAFVTRAKDNEPYSSSGWNMNLPGNPAVDFDSFFNDESVEQEDLVLWVNLGTHHQPRAEDSPHTLTNLASSYLLLTPHNYFDYDVSMESQNAVILNPDKDFGEWEIKGHIDPDYCIPKKPAPFSYSYPQGYREDGKPASPGEVRDFKVDTHAMHDIRAVLPPL
ncbi:amine oxidase catalytic domain-containing protein [Meredithblackwellia eburnea MCA 4105]